MPLLEHAGEALHGRWRDVIYDRAGRETGRSAVRPNAIVLDCRRILASFTGGFPSLGIQGMLFGAGDPAWDAASPPPATPAQTELVDDNPFLVPAASLAMDFVDELGAVSAAPTNRLQIVATLGANEPPWPDGNHVAGSLREFGLVAELGGNPALINYVTHPVINKDAASTLERTVWLVF
jgi:hypothetical protein